MSSASVSQTVATLDAERGELRTLTLPPAPRPRGTPTSTSQAPVERHYWSGQPWQLGSAAYWEQLVAESTTPGTYRLGETLEEEVGACLLGGFGMPFALAAAAFDRLRAEGVFMNPPVWSAIDIEALLREPLTFGASPRRYRFPRQRAERLATAMQRLQDAPQHMDDLGLRDWLTDIPGIGPKTASWVVRNHRASNEVAIIDIHLIRAGIAAGVFSPTWRVTSDYRTFEAAFLGWADHSRVPAALLDACIWGTLARIGDRARDLFGVPALNVTPAPVWPM